MITVRLAFFVQDSISGGLAFLLMIFLPECVIPIPKDDNLNYMADITESEHGYTEPAKDGETGPSPGTGVEQNNNFGDGLVEFEEYRGFMINRTWQRLHATKKDIFVHSKFTGWGQRPEWLVIIWYR